MSDVDGIVLRPAVRWQGDGPKVTISERIIRLLDISISLAVLIFFVPVLAIVAVLIKIKDNGPIFFGHTRIGCHGQEFTCFKFRSMLVDAEARLQRLLDADAQARAEWARDHKLKSDPRITAFGLMLRKTSIDEFPQLWNVLKGDMSLVGPRPIVRTEIRKYGKSFRQYTSVRPGLTGLWQVAGRNDVSYSRRVAMDRLFSRRRSVRLYLYILFMTVPAVLMQRGSY
ncbi:MAG: sugar transferase [Asticcacaulis sp.]|nr:sugar transferase [Asticcacaulis sp.]